MNWLVVSCHGSSAANRDAARRGELHLDRRGFLNPQPSTCRLRRGFSFAEILFAVMILGIGFIMVAAMFPVAIKQTELTSQETAAANMSVAGVSSFEQLGTNAYFPVISSATDGFSTNKYSLAHPVPFVIHSPVFTFHDPRLIPPAYTPGPNALSRDQVWQAVCNNLILPSDARYAWVPMYRRDWLLNDNADPSVATYADYHLSPIVQLTLIGVQIRNRSLYTQQDLTPPGGPGNESTLEGHVTTAIIRQPPFGSSQPGNISFLNQGPNGQFDDASRIGEGAYVVISDDGLPYDSFPGPPAGIFNGWILRVGVYRPDLTAKSNNSPTYELVPGYDLPRGANLGAATFPVQVIVVGRGRGASTSFEGGVQDVSVYTTYIRIQG